MPGRSVTPLVACAALVVGCWSTTSLGPKDPRDPKVAYVYGRFFAASHLFGGLFGTGAPTFEVRCRDGETYEIRFQNTNEIQVVPLPASVCQLENVRYPGHRPGDRQQPGLIGLAVNDRVTRSMASFRLLKNEFLDPGGLYYVGDFRSTVSDPDDNGVNRWGIRLLDKYEETTDELTRKFRGFAEIDTENRIDR